MSDIEVIPEDLVSLKLRKLELLEQTIAEREALPHRYLYKFYPWARKYFDNFTDKIQIICSGNQAGKSSFQIRKTIELAINKDLWKVAWPNMLPNQIPNLFWYLYPDKNIASTEWQFKWKQFMPKDQNHPEYGWSEHWFNKQISHIVFKSGVTISFKTYAQDVSSLQGNSVYFIGIDEEPEFDIVPEIMVRQSATDGLLSVAFTATKGQEEWRQIVEDKTMWTEAVVMQISLYDCQYYEDGTPSHWTNDSIERVKRRCGTENEILKRVWGKFIVDSGRKYSTYSTDNRCKFEDMKIGKNWSKFVGVDIGSGGKKGHPSAICFVAVNPEYTLGYVYKFWRGDGVDTTAQDVLIKYLEMKGEDQVNLLSYDWASKDFFNIAERTGGIPIVKADKGHATGENLLNSLFRNRMLFIPYGAEFDKLSNEFTSLLTSTDKKKARDDGVDSTRYCVCSIPWNWETINIPKMLAKVIKLSPGEQRRKFWDEGDAETEKAWDTEGELDFWQDQLDN